MAIDITSPRSRRTLIVTAVGGVAAAVVATLTGAQRVLAAGSDGQAIEVGHQYLDARSVTMVRNKNNDLTVLQAENVGAGKALVGSSVVGDGVFGQSSGTFGYPIHGESLTTSGFNAAVFSEVDRP